MKIADIRISGEALLKALHFPQGTKMIELVSELDYNESINIKLRVHHPELKNVEAGEKVPLLVPIIREERITMDWNQT